MKVSVWTIYTLILFSLRIGSYDSDRALLVYEKTHPGEVLAAVCPNNKTIVTAGTSTVSKTLRSHPIDSINHR